VASVAIDLIVPKIIVLISEDLPGGHESLHPASGGASVACGLPSRRGSCSPQLNPLKQHRQLERVEEQLGVGSGPAALTKLCEPCLEQVLACHDPRLFLGCGALDL
jgi:hypothetical protein